MTAQELIDALSGGDPDDEVRLLIPSADVLPIQRPIRFSFSVWDMEPEEHVLRGEGVHLVAGDVEPLLKHVLDELFACVNAVAVED